MVAWRLGGLCGALGGPDRSLHRPATSPCLPPHFQPLPFLAPNSRSLPVGLGSTGKWTCCAQCPLWGTGPWAVSALLECVDVSVPGPALLLSPRPCGSAPVFLPAGCAGAGPASAAQARTPSSLLFHSRCFSLSLFFGEKSLITSF